MNEKWDDHERREKNQWSIDSWSALQSAATLLMMAIAGLVWGLKLENRIDMIESSHKSDMEKLDGKIANLETSTQKGILPITEVRLNALENRVDGMAKEINECIKRR